MVSLHSDTVLCVYIRLLSGLSCRARSIERQGQGQTERNFKKVKPSPIQLSVQKRLCVRLHTYRLLLAFTRLYEVLQQISLHLALWKVLSYIQMLNNLAFGIQCSYTLTQERVTVLMLSCILYNSCIIMHHHNHFTTIAIVLIFIQYKYCRRL